MKCVLIHPSWSPEEIFPPGTVSSQINYWQPLGTLYVGASILEAGHDVEFLNGAFLNRGFLICRLLSPPGSTGLPSGTWCFLFRLGRFDAC